MNTIKLVKRLMKIRENYPLSPDIGIGECGEIFRHNIFVKANKFSKREVMLKSSIAKYESEYAYPWDSYFGKDLKQFLENNIVLDLGCNNGGRSVAWYERYKLRKIYGIDIEDVLVESARNFANYKNVNAEFRLGKGEEIPFDSGIFDAILTFDVFEHVQNINKTLKECLRVLRPKGKLYLVFPSYFHPAEHHLSLVTRTPFIHYFFSAKTLIKAYNEIIEERGHDSYWYRRQTYNPEEWERCNAINGTTLRQFKKLISKDKYKIVLQSRKPIGSIGRNMVKIIWPLYFSYILYPMVFIPGIQEIILHRITYILEKN
jgi:SAM-dependent methyltransferase